MKTTKTLPGEQALLESDTGELTLTTHRIRFETRTGSGSRLTSIMLQDVTSCQITTLDKPNLLTLAALAFVGGFLAQMAFGIDGVVPGLIAALVLAVLYVLGRKTVVRIASPSASIDLLMKGFGADRARALIDEIEAAKDDRGHATSAPYSPPTARSPYMPPQ